MLDVRYSHLYFYQSLNRLQRGLSAIAELLVFHDSCRLCIVVLSCTGNASLYHSCILSVKLWLVIRCHVLVRMTRHWWSNDIRYLGVYLTANNVYSCSFSHAKRSFYRAFNGVFGSVGRVASEEALLLN